LAALAAWVVLLLLHPIVAPDFWWHMARGRVVWSGNDAPSRTLLANELNADADWLGGLPWYLLYQNAGPAVLSVLVCGIALMLAVQLARSPVRLHATQSSGRANSLRVVVVFLGFAAARQSWEPTPALFDLCGVIAIWSLVGRLRTRARWINVGALIGCELIWANLGTLPLLGPLVALLRLNMTERDQIRPWHVRSQTTLIGILLVIGSVTPRGIWTDWDCVRLLLPWICTDLETLRAAGILPMFAWPLTAEVAAFVILITINLRWLIRTSAAANWLDLSLTLICVVMTCSSTTNLGPSSLLLLLGTIQLINRPDVVAPAANWFGAMNAIGATAFAIAVAAGFWPGMQTRLGWGLAPQLEPSILERTVSGLSFDGNAYCTGARETGFLAWLRPGTVKPADFPTRALLSGRLKDHLRLGWELAHGWRDQHRRSDGSWGGWSKRFRESHIRLLVISADDVAVIRGLEPTTWKPLAIDTPCLPYGATVDPSINRRLVEIQNLLDVADLGEWTYPQPSSAGVGSHFDLWGLLTGEHDLRTDLRQSRTLAAMNRYISALKVLTPGLRRNDPKIRREFCSIQLALAYRDFLAAGQATGWHLSACLETGADPAVVGHFNPKGNAVFTALPQGFQGAVTAYVRRDFEGAKKVLSDGSPESLLALSQISLEEGSPKQAGRWLKELESKYPDSTEYQAAHDALAPFFR